MSSCVHCGLPSPAEQPFCCFGCELCYRIRAEAKDEHAGLMGRMSFSLVLAMIVMMLALFLYAEDVFDVAGETEMAWLRSVYRWASFVLATPVMVLSGGPLARSAAVQLRLGRLSMDALIVGGAFAAYALSIHGLASSRHALYFDSATAALVLATFGRWLEATAKSKASCALGPLLEVSRGLVRWNRGSVGRVLLAAQEVLPGMHIELDAGQVVPVDMRLEQDAAEFDLAVLSGESRPMGMVRGDTIPAGAVPITPIVEGVALRPARDSALERLSNLARTLCDARSPTLVWADRFANALTPVVAVVALSTVVFWARRHELETGVMAGLAVVLAACPCSYAIASPLVHWIMLKTALGRGVLIRGAETLEELARTRIVAFDKTGTLTRSNLSVVREWIAPSADRAEVLALVGALEKGNAHPVARALSMYVGGAGDTPIEGRRFITGRGVEAIDEHGRRLCIRAGDDAAIVLERDGVVLATFELDEQLRPEARDAVEALREAGIRPILLSGDAHERVHRVRDALGIEAYGRLTPREKVARIEMLGEGAAMVGDGINDAPALASRRASFTLGDAAQLAKGIAQVTLLEPDLRLVPWTLALARRGTRLVKWLLFSSTLYNLLFVGLAARGALKPVWAGVSMMVSSLLAVAFAAAVGRARDGDRVSLELAAELP